MKTKTKVEILVIFLLSIGMICAKAEINHPIDMNNVNTVKGISDKDPEVTQYSVKEIEKVESFICEHFGKFENVLHEIVSDGIHVDICIIPPTEERHFLTLVTMGMGAKKMNVPADLKDEPRSRAELMICLPPDWPITKDSLSIEKWYWPIRLLKKLAHLPFDEDDWLGFGHTIEFEETFDESTRQNGALLAYPHFSNSNQCYLSKRKVVNFFQILPLYQEEMNYKQEYDAESLLKLFSEEDWIVNPSRKSVLDL